MGIGQGMYTASDCDDTPYCVYGHLNDLRETIDYNKILFRVGITIWVNDRAVRTINKNKNAYENARVSFQEWCRELNVVRGS